MRFPTIELIAIELSKLKGRRMIFVLKLIYDDFIIRDMFSFINLAAIFENTGIKS